MNRICGALLFGFFCYVNGISIELVRTTGGHFGTHFFLGPSLQYRFLLFDVTETSLWTFASTDPVEIPYSTSGLYDLSEDDAAVSRIKNGTSNIYTSNKAYYLSGYYDFPLQESLYTVNVSQVMINNVTVRNTSTQIFVLPVTDQIAYKNWNNAMFDGMFGVGKGLLTTMFINYTMGWMNKNSSITLFTSRDVATTGQLLINETTLPSGCSNRGISANLSKTAYLRYEDFEFNITQIQAGISETQMIYYTKTWPATISTMSSFIAVDDYTWDYLLDLINPVFDPYAINGNDIASPFYKVHCSLADQLKITIQILDVNGTSIELLIPGNSLVKPNPNGECLLKVKKNSVDAWVLGTPFLENYCIKLQPQISKINFMNTTDQITYPDEPPQDESKVFYNMLMSRG